MIAAARNAEATDKWLLCQAAHHTCGLPITAVRLTLRRPRLQSWEGQDTLQKTALTDGVAMIRGELVPVVSLGRLLSGAAATDEGRLVLLALDGRRVALGVRAVLGVRKLEPGTLAALPPLLDDERGTFVERLGRVDGELLLVLRTARLLAQGSLTEAHTSEASA